MISIVSISISDFVSKRFIWVPSVASLPRFNSTLFNVYLAISNILPRMENEAAQYVYSNAAKIVKSLTRTRIKRLGTKCIAPDSVNYVV